MVARFEYLLKKTFRVHFAGLNAGSLNPRVTVTFSVNSQNTMYFQLTAAPSFNHRSPFIMRFPYTRIVMKVFKYHDRKQSSHR